jgi:hypothetical protein
MMELLVRVLGWIGAGLLVLGFLLGAATGPRPSHWVRAMDVRGMLRRVRARAEGPDGQLQAVAAVMIWTGLAALIVMMALARGYGIPLGWS